VQAFAALPAGSRPDRSYCVIPWFSFLVNIVDFGFWLFCGGIFCLPKGF
jgi:hypothetical protein